MRGRLFLAFTVVILVTTLSLSFWLRQNTLQEVNAFARRGGFIGAEPLVTDLEAYFQVHHTWSDAGDILSAAPPLMGPGGGNKGSMMGGNFQGGRPMMALVDKEGKVIYGGEDLGNNDQLTEEELSVAIPLHQGDEIIGYLVPVGGGYFQDISLESTLGGRITNAALNAVLVAAGISLVLAFVLGYFLLKPIRQLTQAATDMSDGVLSTRVQISGSSELVALGKTFNSMAESLDEAEKRRRALTADIAHELRTPLAVQRANLEAMQDGIYSLDQENLDLILQQNAMLTQLVDDLRILALTDSDELRLVKEQQSLTALAEQVIEQFKQKAKQSKVQLSLEAENDLPLIEFDTHRVAQILNNLMSNALRHTPDGGQVTLSLSQDSDIVLLSVRDTGPGIAPEALPYIFDRLYRSDHARAREQGGSGLGLTIARHLAEAHGGTLTAENHPNGGAVFTLGLPK